MIPTDEPQPLTPVGQALSPTDQPQTPAVAAPDAKKKKLNDEFKSRITTCKNYRSKLIPSWVANIDVRRGKTFATQSDQDRISVPLDWSMTKTKQASLFSQVPKARIDHAPQSTDAPWVATFEQRLNDTLILAGIESAMDEVLPDVINAAGFGAILVAHEAMTEQVDVPAIDFKTLPPETLQVIQQTKKMPDGSDIPMTTVPRTTDHRYTINRISPSDLLWPINFTGSDFDKAPWIGRTGRMSWAQAQARFKLTDQEKATVLGEEKPVTDRLTNDIEKDRNGSDQLVQFDEIFYKEFEFDALAKSYSLIHHLIFVSGKDEPVIDEAWQGQKMEGDSFVGSSKAPIRVLTLSYITDESIPPSDSAIGRPQVNEINKLRTLTLHQRERSLPVRWFDINRVDLSIQQSLMRGTWQAMIPVQGQGTNVLGEISRATYPQENFAFDKIAKSDLAEVWAVGPDQTSQDIETKGEADVAESHFQTRISRERAKVAKFFCTVAEVLGAFLCLYDAPESFGEGFDPGLSKSLTYSILADSTVLLNATQRLKQLVDFVNFAAKSGFVDVEPVLKEIAALSGLNPNQVIRKPTPKDAQEPNISLRMTGGEDLMNPLMLAFMVNSGQAPSPEQIEQAKKLISMSIIPPQPVPQPEPTMGPDGQPVQQAPTEQPMTPAMPILTPHPGPLPNVQPQPPAPPVVGKANPQWALMDRINKREEEGQ